MPMAHKVAAPPLEFGTVFRAREQQLPETPKLSRFGMQLENSRG